MTDTDGKITVFDGEHAFLSNFHQTDIPVEIVSGESEKRHKAVFHSTEALFQASKVFRYSEGRRIAPTEEEIRRFIEFASMSPSEAKRAGRKVVLPDPAEWDRVKVSVMRRCLELKFRDPVLADKLLSTGSAKLVEGNTWNDRFWGVCNGEGRNMLGELLMERRTLIMERDKGERTSTAKVRIIPVLQAKGHPRQNMVRLAFTDPEGLEEIVAQTGRPDISLAGKRQALHPSVRQDLYQEYKNDVGYGAVEKDMTFDRWMEKYHPEHTAELRARMWRNGPGGDPYVLIESSAPVGNTELVRLLSYFGQGRFLSGREGLEVDMAGRGAQKVIPQGTDNPGKLASLIAKTGPGFDVDLLVGLVKEKELEKTPEAAKRPNALETSSADKAWEKKKADSYLSR